MVGVKVLDHNVDMVIEQGDDNNVFAVSQSIKTPTLYSVFFFCIWVPTRYIFRFLAVSVGWKWMAL